MPWWLEWSELGELLIFLIQHALLRLAIKFCSITVNLNCCITVSRIWYYPSSTCIVLLITNHIGEFCGRFEKYPSLWIINNICSYSFLCTCRICLSTTSSTLWYVMVIQVSLLSTVNKNEFFICGISISAKPLFILSISHCSFLILVFFHFLLQEMPFNCLSW